MISKSRQRCRFVLSAATVDVKLGIYHRLDFTINSSPSPSPCPSFRSQKAATSIGISGRGSGSPRESNQPRPSRGGLRPPPPNRSAAGAIRSTSHIPPACHDNVTCSSWPRLTYRFLLSLSRLSPRTFKAEDPVPSRTMGRVDKPQFHLPPFRWPAAFAHIPNSST
jgi:hypothetical protein